MNKDEQMIYGGWGVSLLNHIIREFPQTYKYLKTSGQTVKVMLMILKELNTVANGMDIQDPRRPEIINKYIHISETDLKKYIKY